MGQSVDETKGCLDVSIIIPAKNEEKNIGKCLDAVFNRESLYRFEVIVIDSGSSDRTTEIVRKYSRVRLVEIPPGDFGHGRTRNLGASMSQGKYVVFLNADAVPADRSWLDSLILPLTKDKNLAGVYSRHLPQEGCRLYMVRDLLKSMPAIPITRSKTKALDFMIFSTVSCALARVTWEKYPFDNDILIAEDQQWAARVLDQGLKILYEPTSRVYHSHNYSPRQLFEIKRRVGVSSGKFKSKFSALVLGGFLILGGLMIKIIGDIGFILFKSGDWGKRTWSQKLKEIGMSIAARAAGFAGRYKGWIYPRRA